MNIPLPEKLRSLLIQDAPNDTTVFKDFLLQLCQGAAGTGDCSGDPANRFDGLMHRVGVFRSREGRGTCYGDDDGFLGSGARETVRILTSTSTMFLLKRRGVANSAALARPLREAYRARWSENRTPRRESTGSATIAGDAFSV